MPISVGSVTGAFEADTLHGEADWQIVRQDVEIEVNAFYSARITNDALVLISNGNTQRIARRSRRPLAGRACRSLQYCFRTTVRIETEGTALAPLHGVLFVAAALREANRVTHTYRVT